MDLGLSGRACIVTGASRGIGLATARALCAEGADVLMVARDPGALETAAATCSGGRAVPCPADVTDGEGVPGLVDACEEAFGSPIWALVNNAGTSSTRPFEELTEDDWELQWSLNVLAPWRLMAAAAPRMAAAGDGRIVNVASSSGKRPSLNNVAYSVTKAAQLSLSRAFADAWAPRGVRVNAVAPGVVGTDLWLGEGGLADQQAQAGDGDREAVLEAVRARTPLRRMGEPEEIAAVIAFLCSAQAANVAGAAWSVDGGTVQVIL